MRWVSNSRSHAQYVLVVVLTLMVGAAVLLGDLVEGRSLSSVGILTAGVLMGVALVVAARRGARVTTRAWAGRRVATGGRHSVRQNAIVAQLGELIVRPCRRSELQAVVELWAAARSRPASLPDAQADLERLLDHAADSLLVAELGGQVVGALIASSDGWRGNMYRLAVLPDHRGDGIALQLVREGERALKAKRVRRVTAVVANDDEPAVVKGAKTLI